MRRGNKAAIGLASMTLVLTAGATAAQAVIGSDEGSNDAYQFVAQVQVGDEIGSGCTGALVSAQWILTAKQCFGAEVQAGAPPAATTVTVGRTDRATTAGRVVQVNRLVPSPGRDVVLARLTQTVRGLPVVRVATTAPAAGDELRLLGFGRTKTDWVPDRLHGATVTVSGVGATTLSAAPAGGADAAVCKGDAGGPAVRSNGGVTELVALHKESGQSGCYKVDGTGTGSVETRVDDLASWIAETTKPRCNVLGGVTDAAGVSGPFPDFDGDCVADLIGNLATSDGILRGWKGSGDTAGQAAAFPTWHVVGGGWTMASVPRIVMGDFDGDNKTDIMRQMADGDLLCWRSSGDLSADNKLFAGEAALVGTGWTTSARPRIITGDFNGDGRTDIGGVYTDGAVRVFPSSGTIAERLLFPGSGSYHPALGLTVANAPRLFTMDIDADGDTDLFVQRSDGKVYLYRSSGNASGENTLFNTAPVHVGTSWTTSNVPRILTGDFNGDERSDAAMVLASGAVRVWITGTDPNVPWTGGGLNFDPKFTTDTTVRVVTGDQDFDGLTDLFVQTTAGSLNLWRSSGDTSGPTTLFPPPARQVGSGWGSNFVRVF